MEKLNSDLQKWMIHTFSVILSEVLSEFKISDRFKIITQYINYVGTIMNEGQCDYDANMDLNNFIDNSYPKQKYSLGFIFEFTNTSYESFAAIYNKFNTEKINTENSDIIYMDEFEIYNFFGYYLAVLTLEEKKIIETATSNEELLGITSKNSKVTNVNKNITPTAFSHIHFNHTSVVTNIFDSLKKNEFIDSSSSIRDFNNIFSNKEPKNKIKWTANISDLWYFVRCLIENKKILPLGNNIWKVTNQCFVDKDGNEFGWKRFKGLHKTANAEKIKKAALQTA